jgi:hypothetical protein
MWAHGVSKAAEAAAPQAPQAPPKVSWTALDSKGEVNLRFSTKCINIQDYALAASVYVRYNIKRTLCAI